MFKGSRWRSREGIGYVLSSGCSTGTLVHWATCPSLFVGIDSNLNIPLSMYLCIRTPTTQKTEKSTSPKGIPSLANFFLSLRLRTTKGTLRSKLRSAQVTSAQGTSEEVNSERMDDMIIERVNSYCCGEPVHLSFSSLFHPVFSTLHTSDCIYCWNCLKSKHSIIIVFRDQNTKLFAPLESPIKYIRTLSEGHGMPCPYDYSPIVLHT